MEYNEQLRNTEEKLREMNNKFLQVGETQMQSSDMTLENLNLTREGLTNEEREKVKARRAHVREMLLTYTDGFAEVPQELDGIGDLYQEAAEEKRQLDMIKNRSVGQKLINDFLGKQKRAANRRLDEIKRKRDLIFTRRYDSSVSLKEIKDERGGILGLKDEINSSVHSSNYSRYNTAGQSKFLENADASSRPIVFSSDSGVYKGRVFIRKDARRNSTIPKDRQRNNELHLPEGSNGERYLDHRAYNKTVIMFTGSGESGLCEANMGKMVNEYVRQGARVILFDYRNYGNSRFIVNGNEDENVIPNEKSITEDGERIFNFVKNEYNLKNEDIILHGYSLGGVVASHVAAKIAEENSKKNVNGRNTTEEKDKLGGLVMVSPMESLKFASTAVAGGFKGFCSQYGGSYNTTENLKVLNHYDPSIPVMFVGGSTVDLEHEVDDPDSIIYRDEQQVNFAERMTQVEEKDFLSPEFTKIRDKTKFRNSAYYKDETGGHLKVSYGGENLRKLILNGRDTNFNE